MRFRATVQSHGKTATGIQVPDEVVISLGAGKRPPVLVTINGYTYRSSIAVMAGKFMIGVSAEIGRGLALWLGMKSTSASKWILSRGRLFLPPILL
ncbi:DUF1905 domain-containing protein [Spirosoma aureum]|uniref:DUF1905 domain-containing protein n=1 Tax=Spirosoma aureum TaxID=2692134 RepID=UPI0018D8B36A|nr:DUF1905 domain-containing protein [Spirosoma aureum]